MEFFHLFMINGNQSHVFKSFTLHSIMNDITKTIKFLSGRQFLLGLLYGCGNSETETTTLVYLYLKQNLMNYRLYMMNFVSIF